MCRPLISSGPIGAWSTSITSELRCRPVLLSATSSAAPVTPPRYGGSFSETGTRTPWGVRKTSILPTSPKPFREASNWFIGNENGMPEAAVGSSTCSGPCHRSISPTPGPRISARTGPVVSSVCLAASIRIRTPSSGTILRPLKSTSPLVTLTFAYLPVPFRKQANSEPGEIFTTPNVIAWQPLLAFGSPPPGRLPSPGTPVGRSEPYGTAAIGPTLLIPPLLLSASTPPPSEAAPSASWPMLAPLASVCACVQLRPSLALRRRAPGASPSLDTHAANSRPDGS